MADANAVCFILGNALGRGSAKMYPKVGFCSFLPYLCEIFTNCNGMYSTCKQIPFGGLYNAKG